MKNIDYEAWSVDLHKRLEETSKQLADACAILSTFAEIPDKLKRTYFELDLLSHEIPIPPADGSYMGPGIKWGDLYRAYDFLRNLRSGQS